MKLAHLILCHTKPEQLQRLIKNISQADAHIYIHVDKRIDINLFLPLSLLANVYFIKERENVNWGGYSIVQATINGFKQILSSGIEYGYINLLSGQDYPLKSSKEIHEFFATNPGVAFMDISSSKHSEKLAKKLRKYYLTDLNIKGSYLAELILTALFPRKIPETFTAVGNSQWFTIPPYCVEYIVEFLKNNPEIKRLFKFMWAPDDMIFQSILFNSPFKDIIVNNDLRYADWSLDLPSPKVLTIADFEKLVNSDKLYARKFDINSDSEILDSLDRHMISRSV